MANGTRPAWQEALAVIVAAGVCLLPNLGAHSLWDVDEARNAECAREMWEAGDWIVPTFNYQLRTDKPVLPYWAVMVSFNAWGVHEWAARLPSALAGIGTCLLTWWLAKEMFRREAGLLAGLLLPATVIFNVLGHAVTPDALLIFSTTAALCCAWRGIRQGRRHWLAWFGLWTGLATLTKGAVGILLPMTAVGLFLIWERKLSCLASRWLLLGIIVFLVVTLPWYIAVGVATKGAWLVGFFQRHHVQRFTTPLEGHSGGIWYHPVVLLVGFAPWTAWLVAACWAFVGRLIGKMPLALPSCSAVTSQLEADGQKERGALRFLLCWIATWLIFFSLAQTKLPNYVAPIYPALAIVCSWWLSSWARGDLPGPTWGMPLAFVGLILLGAGTSVGLALACGWYRLDVLEGWTIPDLAWLSGIGLVPVTAAVIAARAWWANNRWSAIAGVTAGGILFVAIAAAWGPVLVDNSKIAHRIGRVIRESQQEQEVRVACYGWFPPSIVFYVGRPVANLSQLQDAQDWLEHPLESYLIVSRPWWEERLQSKLAGPYTILSSYWDFTRRREILVVVNRAREKAAVAAREQVSFD